MDNQHKQPLDQDLMKRAGNGDADAFGDLYERYLDPIYRYTYYRLPTAEDAEDLTEMIFLKAWENITNRKSGSEIENVRAWLYRIAHNLVVDFHRKKRIPSVDIESQLSIEDPDSLSTEETVQLNLDYHQLKNAITQLDDQAQEIITLRFINRLSHREITHILDIKEGNIRVIQYRALKKLKSLIGEENYGRP